jgi:hypothetical protein
MPTIHLAINEKGLDIEFLTPSLAANKEKREERREKREASQ